MLTPVTPASQPDATQIATTVVLPYTSPTILQPDSTTDLTVTENVSSSPSVPTPAPEFKATPLLGYFTDNLPVTTDPVTLPALSDETVDSTADISSALPITDYTASTAGHLPLTTTFTPPPPPPPPFTFIGSPFAVTVLENEVAAQNEHQKERDEAIRRLQIAEQEILVAQKKTTCAKRTTSAVEQIQVLEKEVAARTEQRDATLKELEQMRAAHDKTVAELALAKRPKSEQTMTPQDLAICKEVHAGMIAKQRSSINYLFLEPVDLATYSDYLGIVDHPMDLRTLKENIENGSYATREEFYADAKLFSTTPFCLTRTGTQHSSSSLPET
jgi:hypothetical protein